MQHMANGSVCVRPALLQVEDQQLEVQLDVAATVAGHHVQMLKPTQVQASSDGQ